MEAVISQSPGQIQALTNGKLITILSIDGGGIREIISATILTYLESQLQLDGEDVRIVDYFDVIAGTRTGGLVTSMLTALSENNCFYPIVQLSKNIKDFYLDNCPKILPQESPKYNKGRVKNRNRYVLGPKYDGKYLRELVKEKLRETKLHQTLTKESYININKSSPFL
ncbi:patatin-like protein 2 [Camellia sinensis]|uniref:patatin-like protein 2 n=1 Tax=Camellia sinensis TaxID=4442 RepID=UPI001035FA8C|nr:patatin-like protein 2 [Camellia sinensis]